MNHHFLIMWDCNGLEYLVDITADEQRRMWEQLRGEMASESAIPNINHLMLRARYNSQRHYEIYIVEATEGITEDDLREMFELDPQYAADTIRRLGQKLYSDRVDTCQMKIL